MAMVAPPAIVVPFMGARGMERHKRALRDAQVFLADIGGDQGAGRIAGTAEFDPVGGRAELLPILVVRPLAVPDHHLSAPASGPVAENSFGPAAHFRRAPLSRLALGT